MDDTLETYTCEQWLTESFNWEDKLPRHAVKYDDNAQHDGENGGYLRMTEKRRLETAAPAMNRRMTTRRIVLVLFPFTPARGSWVLTAMVGH